MLQLQSSKLFQSTAHHHHRLLQPPLKPPCPPQNHHKPTPSPPQILKHPNCKLSRRELAIFSKSSLLLLCSQALLPGNSRAGQDMIEPQENLAAEQEIAIPADDNPAAATEHLIQPDENAAPTAEDLNQSEDKIAADEPSPPPSKAGSICEKVPTKRAFLDISIDGEPIGRIIVGIYGDSAPFGASRFIDLVSGRAGISYRRKDFIKIMPNYVQHGGVRSYGVDAELAGRTGKDLKNDALKKEWERAYGECPGTKNLAGSVSIIVRDPLKPPPKVKLVAREGKLVVDEEEVGVEPNGTEFVISTRDSPELDGSALVIGRVVEGMDVVQRIGRVKTVQENTSSPYFRVAKLIGDKRAVVAERGFNRPYSKVTVTNCGLLD